MAGDAGILTGDHICAQCRGEGGSIGERKEIGLAVVAHCSVGCVSGWYRYRSYGSRTDELEARYAEAVTALCRKVTKTNRPRPFKCGDSEHAVGWWWWGGDTEYQAEVIFFFCAG